MKSITKYLTILLLLSVAIVCIGSSSVTASSSPLMWNNTTLTIAPFYGPTFGVHIFQGADPIGAYWINVDPYYAHIPHQVG
jgi:hypothetical protein